MPSILCQPACVNGHGPRRHNYPHRFNVWISGQVSGVTPGAIRREFIQVAAPA